MDIITQGLIGAVAAQTVAKPNQIRLATWVGFCAPLLADADAFIRSAEDPLLFLEYHRHFSHALIFIPVGALIASLLLWPILRKSLPFKTLYLFALMGYSTAGLLDACTSYGTHLLWPFSDERIAWSMIAIFDPVFSFALIIAMVVAATQQKPRAAWGGIVFVAIYLGLATVQHQRAQSLAKQLAQQRDHQVERLIVKPTMGNLLLWRSVYESNDRYFVDAIRVGMWGDHQIFKGNWVPVFKLKQDLPQLTEEMTIYQDIQRFERFSNGFLVQHPKHPDVLGDIRYAMLPTSTHPLWGIQLPLDSPDQHVTFNTYRELSKTDRATFFNQLFH